MKIKKLLKFIDGESNTSAPLVEIFSKDEKQEKEQYYWGAWDKVPYNLLNKKIISIRSFQGNYGIKIESE